MFKKFLDKAKDVVKTLAADFNVNEENPETDPDKLWAISLSAPIANAGWQFINSLETGMDKASIVDGIGAMWDINSKETAKGTIQWLANGGHRIYYPFVLHLFETQDSKAWKEATIEHLNSQDMDDESKQDAFERISSMLGNLKEAVGILKYKQDIGPDELKRGILAWDVARSVILARQCHDAGLLTSDEAWAAIFEVVVPVKQTYSSWKEYWQGFILGRTLWSGLGDSFEAMSEEGAKLLSKEDSPYKTISW